MKHRSWSIIPLTALLLGVCFVRLPAQPAPPLDPSLFTEMRWRNIGPFRAGRPSGAAGHPTRPYTLYIGL
jgi:hypothetical protein